MTIQDLAQAMGSMASEREAIAMQHILRERNLDIDELSDEEFFSLIPEAIKRATETAD